MTTLWLTLGFAVAFLGLLYAVYSIGLLKAYNEVAEADLEEIKEKAEVSNEVRDNVLKLDDAAVHSELHKWRR